MIDIKFAPVKIMRTSITSNVLQLNGRTLPVTIFRSNPDSARPIIVFFPSGGFVTRFPVRYALCERLASTSNCVVVCVDYRLAPEHPFPAAPYDCYEAVEQLYSQASEIGGDSSVIFVGGESAGATLASITCLIAKERRGPHIVGQILAYPFVGGETETESRRALGPVSILVDGWRSYVPKPQDSLHPYATPLNATNLAGLPPALIFTGEIDPLRDEGHAFALRLKESGNDTTCVQLTGAPHGFLTSSKTPEARETALEITRSWIEKIVSCCKDPRSEIVNYVSP